MTKYLLGLLLVGFSLLAQAETLGAVDTAFQLLGPDHKIVIEVFDDPKVKGVSCYVSRAKTGGFLGGVGLASDPAEASVACRQVGPISFASPLPKQEDVFSEKASVLFKTVRVARVVDPARNALVYLVYSTKMIDGSPRNSVTAVPVGRETPIPVTK